MFLINPGRILEDYIEHILTKADLSDRIMLWTYETMTEKTKEERFKNAGKYNNN